MKKFKILSIVLGACLLMAPMSLHAKARFNFSLNLFDPISLLMPPPPPPPPPVWVPAPYYPVPPPCCPHRHVIVKEHHHHHYHAPKAQK